LRNERARATASGDSSADCGAATGEHSPREGAVNWWQWLLDGAGIWLAFVAMGISYIAGGICLGLGLVALDEWITKK